MHETHLYDINLEAHKNLWNKLFFVMVLGGLSIALLLGTVLIFVFETSIGSALIGALAIAWGRLVINYQTKIADGYKIEVDDNSLDLTLPDRHISFPREGFIKAKEHPDGVRLYHRNRQPLYVPKTLENYEAFKQTMQAWMPYERFAMVNELWNSAAITLALLFTVALLLFAASQYQVSKVVGISVSAMIVFALMAYILLQIVYDSVLRQRLSLIILAFVGVIMLVTGWQVYISG
jgi:hypothetical protein